MTTQKKQYEKPSMQVFDLKQQPTLLAGSVNSGDVNATMDGVFTEESASPEMFDEFTKLIGELQ